MQDLLAEIHVGDRLSGILNESTSRHSLIVLYVQENKMLGSQNRFSVPFSELFSKLAAGQMVSVLQPTLIERLI